MLVSAFGAAIGMPLPLVDRVVELPEEFMHVIGSPMLRDQDQSLTVRSLAGALDNELGLERICIVIAVPSPYALAVGVVSSFSMSGLSTQKREVDGATMSPMSVQDYGTIVVKR
jgi:hypothetical protein